MKYKVITTFWNKWAAFFLVIIELHMSLHELNGVFSLDSWSYPNYQLLFSAKKNLFPNFGLHNHMDS